MSVRIAVRRLPHAADLPLPARASEQAAGVDLCAAVEADLVLPPGHRAVVPTGLVIALPPGHDGQVRPRSGLARKHGLTVLNAPGTIDPDYRGEIGVLLVNLGQEPVVLQRGMRIAQLVVARHESVEWLESPQLDRTDRGDGGFGSTGQAI